MHHCRKSPAAVASSFVAVAAALAWLHYNQFENKSMTSVETKQGNLILRKSEKSEKILISAKEKKYILLELNIFSPFLNTVTEHQ